MPCPYNSMTDDSLEILWRGSDPAKFTALQAALRDEGIPFWHMQAHDHAGGFLSSRPYYLEAVAGFEIRVHSADLEKAKAALAWIESKESAPAIEENRVKFERERPNAGRILPYDWDPNEATSETWSGEDETTAEYLASALRENGIPSRIPDEPGHRVRLCVRAEDVTRAREIVRQITDGAAPA
jgi:putative signal transducing protein